MEDLTCCFFCQAVAMQKLEQPDASLAQGAWTYLKGLSGMEQKAILQIGTGAQTEILTGPFLANFTGGFQGGKKQDPQNGSKQTSCQLPAAKQ